MASFDKRGEYQWRARVRRDGQTDLTKTFETRKDAEDWAREVERRISRGEIDGLDPSTQRITVQDAIESYKTEVMPGLARAGKGTADVALRRIEAKFGAVFVATLRSKDINEWASNLAKPLPPLPAKQKTAQSQAMQRYRDRIKAERDARINGTDLPPRTEREKAPLNDNGLGSQTVLHQLNTFSALIKHAQTHLGVHMPAGNPLALVKRPAPSKARDRVLREGELEYLIKAARHVGEGPSMTGGEMMEPMILLALETSMREGELIATQWDWISLKHSTLSLPATVTKNGEGRTVALSSVAVRVLSGLTRKIHGRVFENWKDIHSFSRPWQRVLKRARILYQVECEENGTTFDSKFLADLRFHDLRHDATTRLFEKGLNPMEVASMTGHKSMQMLKRYTHVNAAKLAQKLG